MALIVIVTLWFITLPTVLYVCVYRGGGLQALWTILPLAYFTLNVNLIVNYLFFTDWQQVGEEVRKRKELARREDSSTIDYNGVDVNDEQIEVAEEQKDCIVNETTKLI